MKLLIAYSSTHGHTARIAERIAARLQQHGHDVIVSDRLARLRVPAFDAIIVGGRVHGSRYPWRVTRFIRKHLAVLRSRPSAFFSVSLLQLARDPRRRADTLALPGRVSAALGWTPDRLAVFGGALRWKAQYGVLSPLAKLMWRRALGAALARAQAEQVFTDWHAVDEFADAFSFWLAARQGAASSDPSASASYG